IPDSGAGAATSLSKTGAVQWDLSGASTYTGTTTITGGTLSVNAVANAGSASPIGAAGTSAANLVINGGALEYTGAGHSTDRLFTIGATTLAAEGAGSINFTNSGPPAGTGPVT